jgi:hypothetical protein
MKKEWNKGEGPKGGAMSEEEGVYFVGFSGVAWSSILTNDHSVLGRGDGN